MCCHLKVLPISFGNRGSSVRSAALLPLIVRTNEYREFRAKCIPAFYQIDATGQSLRTAFSHSDIAQATAVRNRHNCRQRDRVILSSQYLINCAIARRESRQYCQAFAVNVFQMVANNLPNDRIRIATVSREVCYVHCVT